jgi:hypothetical protein
LEGELTEPKASARGSNLATARLSVDGVKFGRFVACRAMPGGVEFEGNEARRTVSGGWSLEFSFGEPRIMLVRAREAEGAE